MINYSCWFYKKILFYDNIYLRKSAKLKNAPLIRSVSAVIASFI